MTNFVDMRMCVRTERITCIQNRHTHLGNIKVRQIAVVGDQHDAIVLLELLQIERFAVYGLAMFVLEGIRMWIVVANVSSTFLEQFIYFQSW